MTVTALRIDLESIAERIELPDDCAGRRQALRDLVGGSIDRGVYHRRALMHVHGEGAVSG